MSTISCQVYTYIVSTYRSIKVIHFHSLITEFIRIMYIPTLKSYGYVSYKLLYISASESTSKLILFLITQYCEIAY